MQRFPVPRRPGIRGRPVLVAALAVVFVDELADGTRSAAFPLLQHGLGLTYAQVGLLVSVPLVLGSLLELPTGILAGQGTGRRRTVLAGGLVFVASLAAAAGAGSFAWLLAVFVVFFPASGAFVTLTQAGLMDAAPARRAQHLARWTLAGSAGAVAGPLLLAGVAAAGGDWRAAYLVLATVAAAAWLAVAWAGPRVPGRGADPGTVCPAPARAGWRARALAWRARALGRARRAAAAARTGRALRWLVLLQAADLLLDVLTGFVALYLVDVARATPGQAALGVGVRLGAGLAGDALLVHLLERSPDLRLLRAGTMVAAAAYPAFLLLPGLGLKLAVLAVLSVATAPWYPVLQARWYRSLAGHSDVAVSLESAAALAGGLAPAVVGAVAGWAGLGWALAGLAAAPLVILAGSAGGTAGTAPPDPAASAPGPAASAPSQPPRQPRGAETR